MKIVDWDGLVNSPRGTIFAEWKPAYINGEFSRLGDVIMGDDGEIIDFFCCEVLAFIPNGNGPCVSSIEGRDATYDYDRKFLIWEREDIDRVVRILTGTDTDEDNIWPDEPIEGAR